MNDKIIFIKNNFLSKEECNNLIYYYEKNINDTFKYGGSYPLNTPKFSNITNRIEDICYKLDPNCVLNTHQIVKWSKSSEMKPHFDPENDVFACLVYLNDNYSGGETGFKKNFLFNRNIKPETGKLVIFSNSKILHWVNKIKNGTRYTLALWFVSK